MAFVRIDGFSGMVYVPEKSPRPQKHLCTDCFECAFCSDERCALCLKRKSKMNNIGDDEKSS